MREQRWNYSRHVAWVCSLPMDPSLEANRRSYLMPIGRDRTHVNKENTVRICMTHFAFYPTTGGVESHLLELCGALVREGHEVFALVGSRDDSPSYEQIDGIEVYRRDWMNVERVRERKQRAGYAAPVVWPELLDEFRDSYRAFVDRHGCDIVHAHNFHHFLPEYGLALS